MIQINLPELGASFLSYTPSPSVSFIDLSEYINRKMYKQLQETLNCVSKFSSLHNVDVEFSIVTVGDLKRENGNQPHLWTQFEKNAGVYVLFGIDTNETLYIGKSDTDLGSRVHPMIHKSSHTVASDIKSNDIILVASLKQFPYLASALETHLIREISPKHNKTLNKP